MADGRKDEKPTRPLNLDGDATLQAMRELAERARCAKFESLGDPICGPLPAVPRGKKPPTLP